MHSGQLPRQFPNNFAVTGFDTMQTLVRNGRGAELMPPKPSRRSMQESVRYAFPPTDGCRYRRTDLCRSADLLDRHSATNRLDPPSVRSCHASTAACGTRIGTTIA